MLAFVSVLLAVVALAPPGRGEERPAASERDRGTRGQSLEVRVLEEAATSSSWAGSWRDADGVLVLAFADGPDAATRQLLDSLSASASPVRMQRVRFRMSELRAVDQQLYQLATGRPGLATIHSWAIRPDRNRVVGYVRSADQARAELTQAGVDLGKVDFETRGQLFYQPLVCSRTNCVDEPMRGGLAWYSDRGRCTTGFGATRNGVEGFLSAGHCAPSGEEAFVGEPPWGTFYGEIARSVQSSTTDALFAERDPSEYPSSSRGWVYVSSSDPRQVVSSREPRGGYGRGSTSCMSGMISGRKCGRIQDGSYTDTFNGLRDVVLVDKGMCGMPGDSGAPVFEGAKALGVFTGVLVDGLDPAQQCQLAVYHKLFYEEDGTGARIILE